LRKDESLVSESERSGYRKINIGSKKNFGPKTNMEEKNVKQKVLLSDQPDRCPWNGGISMRGTGSPGD